MEKATFKLSQRLLGRIYTTNVLKHISETLETLTQNTTFKEHANSIVTDSSLTDPQKRTQLLYLLRSVDAPLLYEFMSDELVANQFWLFHTDKLDYFDRFVQDFQRLTETISIINLVTVVPLAAPDLKSIAEDFTKTFGYKVIINHELNPALLGGVQLRIENLIFDYSLRSKFQQFQYHWLASLENLDQEIGRNQPEVGISMPD